jgi:hypothetical protein
MPPNSGLKPRAIAASNVFTYESLDLVLLGAMRRVGTLVEELPRIEANRSQRKPQHRGLAELKLHAVWPPVVS